MTALARGVTLRGLEVFEAVAQTGSVAEAAERLGMSAPAVSQQLKNLHAALGVALVDQSRRPMTLTPAGRLFLRRAEEALAALRLGSRDIVGLDLSGLTSLRLGVIEDFENEVTPRLAADLAETMAQCSFRLTTAASHTLVRRLANRELDLAVGAETDGLPETLARYPLLSDPYILAVPRGRSVAGGLQGLADLPLIRRAPEQVMGMQIDRALARAGLRPPDRFVIDSNQSISALVAAGLGWTVTTPLSLLRASRFLPRIDAHPMPGPEFERRIALLATEDWAGAIPDRMAGQLRDLIGAHFTAPGLEAMPWLKGRFAVLG